jgi:hypothetical protein
MLYSARLGKSSKLRHEVRSLLKAQDRVLTFPHHAKAQGLNPRITTPAALLEVVGRYETSDFLHQFSDNPARDGRVPF